MRDEHMIERHGKTFVLYSGLLDEAHAIGLRSIDTELIQAPHEANNNVAIVKAIVEIDDVERGTGELLSDKPKRFTGIGDASTENTGRMVANALLRMAETRAKARALRDAVNIGVVSLEEAGDGDDNTPRERAKNPSQNNGQPKARKSQVDMLATLAVDLRGEQGVARLEQRIGKPLAQLTKDEADEWIEKLTPEDQQ